MPYIFPYKLPQYLRSTETQTLGNSLNVGLRVFECTYGRRRASDRHWLKTRLMNELTYLRYIMQILNMRSNITDNQLILLRGIIKKLDSRVSYEQKLYVRWKDATGHAVVHATALCKLCHYSVLPIRHLLSESGPTCRRLRCGGDRLNWKNSCNFFILGQIFTNICWNTKGDYSAHCVNASSGSCY